MSAKGHADCAANGDGDVNMMRRHGCPSKQKVVAEFVGLSECNPGTLRYDIVVKTSQHRLALITWVEKT